MSRLITLLKRSVMSFGSDRCATLAAAIAYQAVFALFPMALVGISLLGFFVGDQTARQQVVDGLTSVITLGDQGQEALTKTLEGVNRAKGVIGLIGLITAAWSASSLFGAIRAALNQVWDVDRPRPILRAKAQDLLLFLGFGGLLAASTAATGVLQAAQGRGAEWLGPLADAAAPLFALITFLAPVTLTFCAFMFLYRFGPHARLGWRDVWPAALIAALFFDFGKVLLAYYIRNLGNFNALAGSLGAAILFLVFVYYAAQVILFAAEFAKHRMLVRTGTLPATDPKLPKAKVPLTQKAMRLLRSTWFVDAPHHDAELPYQPGRIDPATNRPTNTREEVLLKQRDAREQAARDAGQPLPLPQPMPLGVMTLTNGAAADGHTGDHSVNGHRHNGHGRAASSGAGAETAEAASAIWRAAGFAAALVAAALTRRHEPRHELGATGNAEHPASGRRERLARRR